MIIILTISANVKIISKFIQKRLGSNISELCIQIISANDRNIKFSDTFSAILFAVHARKNGLNSNTLYGFQKWQVKPIYQILVFQFSKILSIACQCLLNLFVHKSLTDQKGRKNFIVQLILESWWKMKFLGFFSSWMVLQDVKNFNEGHFKIS